MPSSPSSPSAPHQLPHRLQGQLGAGFIKAGSFRWRLLAALGVFLSLIIHFSFTYLFSKRLGEGVPTWESRLECGAALCLPHLLPPLLSINTSHIVPFKCITSQSRHSLNCNGFGSLGSSISSSGWFALMWAINLFPGAAASFAAQEGHQDGCPTLCRGLKPQNKPGGGCILPKTPVLEAKLPSLLSQSPPSPSQVIPIIPVNPIIPVMSFIIQVIPILIPVIRIIRVNPSSQTFPLSSQSSPSSSQSSPLSQSYPCHCFALTSPILPGDG